MTPIRDVQVSTKHQTETLAFVARSAAVEQESSSVLTKDKATSESAPPPAILASYILSDETTMPL